MHIKRYDTKVTDQLSICLMSKHKPRDIRWKIYLLIGTKRKNKEILSKEKKIICTT